MEALGMVFRHQGFLGANFCDTLGLGLYFSKSNLFVTDAKFTDNTGEK